jgi:hypothetical protein
MPKGFRFDFAEPFNLRQSGKIMNIKSILHVIVFLFAVSFCNAQSNVSSQVFPEVGKTYKIQFASGGESDLVQLGVPPGQTSFEPYSGCEIKVIARREHEWCLVEYLSFTGRFDEKTKHPTFRKYQYWLNFGVLVLAQEIPELENKDRIIINP